MRYFVFLTIFFFCNILSSYIFDSYQEFMNILHNPDLSRLMRNHKLKQLVSDNIDVNANKNGCYLLHEAISSNNKEAVRLLLENGADPDVKDQRGLTPLQKSFSRYGKDYSSLLLENGANPDTLISGEPLLLYAYKNKKMKLVQKLIDKGVNPDVVDSKGYSILYRILQMDSPEILEHFFQLRPRMSSGNDEGSILTDLMYRLEQSKGKGKEEIDFRKLIKNITRSGMVLNKQNYNGKTPLYVSMEQDDLDMFSYFLDKGANTEICDNEGKTVLYASVVKNKISFLRMLIEKGADPNIVDNNGIPMLHAAIDNGNMEILKLLKKNYLRLNVLKEGRSKITAIHHALMYKDVGIAKWLVRNGADFNIADKNKLYPLDYAIQLNLNKAIIFLNRMKAKRSNRSIKIYPYYYQQTNKNASNTADLDVVKACKKGKSKALEKLINAGADLDSLGPDGKTLLHYAVNSGNEDTIFILLDSGVNIEKKSRNGSSVLLDAVKKKKLCMSEILLQNGAEVNTAGRNGLTPLHYAVLNKDKEMVKLLLDYNADSSIKDNNNKSCSEIPTSAEIKKLLGNP